MKSFLERAKELNETTLKDRRYLHENAEIGMNLPVTAAYVMRRLREIGLEPKEICSSGVTAVIDGGKPGKTILLRADMDALPMEEHNELPYKTKTCFAHTCGHDMHAAMLLTAAQMLFEKRDLLQGRVKLMFQPDEESFTGAHHMIEAGILRNPDVDAAMGMHIMLDDKVGTICYGEGNMTSSCDGFKLIIKGKGCHGAMPQLGIDPINVGVHIYLAFQELIAREVPPTETAILTFGQFTAGSNSNIIPETAVLQGTLRTYNKEVRDKLVTRMKEIAQFTAKTYKAEVEYEVLAAIPSIYTEPDMLKEMVGYIREMGGDFKEIPQFRLTPSEDFAFIAQKVPSVFLLNCAKVEGNPYQHHNPGVIFDEGALPIGAAIHAQCAVNWLKNHAQDEAEQIK